MRKIASFRRCMSHVSLLFLFTFFVSSVVVTAQSDTREQVRNLYQQGVQELENENAGKAYTSFQKAIEAANELAPEERGRLLRWLWEQTNTELFNRMLADPELRHAAERILELSKGAYWTWKMDESRIAELVEDLTAEGYQTRLEAQRKLMAAGEYAAPGLIQELASADAEARTMAITTLSEMGEKVLLPVVEALKSNDKTQRRNAALVLGNLEDPRAIPALKKRFESDSSNLVRREARESIMNILESRIPSRLKTAVADNDRARLRNVLQGRVDQLMVRAARRKQNHTHNWANIKNNYLRINEESGGGQDVDSSEHIIWEGASDLGLKNIYIDDVGLKYIVHTHDVAGDTKTKENHTHRHYLTHLRGLPSQLKQHVFGRRASGTQEIVSEQLDRLLSKSAREEQGHQHWWEEIQDDVLADKETSATKSPKKSDHQQWPGASALGLRNVYQDEAGMKYILHRHGSSGDGADALGVHRHYLRNIKGLPSRLRNYVDYWRSLEVKLFEAQTFQNLVSSEKLYHRLAESYYLAEPQVMRKLYGDALIWNWNKERQRVEAKKVPEFAYNLELAAQTSMEGLEANPRYRPNWPLLVSAYFSMYDQAKTILAHGDKMKRMEVLTEKSLERLREDFKRRELMLLPGQLLNQESLYATLSRAIRDGRPAVAMKTLEFITDFLETDDLPAVDDPAWKQEVAPAYPVVRSLREGNVRMKYKAASVLAEMKPLERFYEWEQVVPALAEAVRMTGLRKVVFSSEDQEQVNRVRKVLRDPNLQSDMDIARTPKELLSKVKSSPLADAVIVDGDMIGHVLYSFTVPGRSEGHQKRVIDSLRQDVRSKGIPVIAIADDDAEKTDIRETYGERIQHIIIAPVTVKKLQDVFEGAGDELKTEQAGVEVYRDPGVLSLMAARSLGSIHSRDTVFSNYRGAVVDLSETLADRSDALRIAACKALGRIGDHRAIPPILNTLDRQEDPAEVRVAAGKALARIFHRLEFTPSDSVLRVILKNATSGPSEVQQASTRAFGAANMKESRRFELLQKIKQQISDQTATADN